MSDTTYAECERCGIRYPSDLIEYDCSYDEYLCPDCLDGGYDEDWRDDDYGDDDWELEYDDEVSLRLYYSQYPDFAPDGYVMDARLDYSAQMFRNLWYRLRNACKFIHVRMLREQKPDLEIPF